MAGDDRGPELQAVCSTFVSLAFVASLLRIYVRARIVKAFGWDDVWMMCAMLTYVMFNTCAIGGVHYGTGRHMTELNPVQILKALRYWWLCYIAYCLTMIAAKVSIGLFLLRITVNKVHRLIIYTAMCFTLLTGIMFFFVTLLQCLPVSYFWNKAQTNGRCLDTSTIIAITFFYSVVSAICDFTLGLLPVFIVWDLHMAKSSKIALVPILSMGCIASTAVIVRMGFIHGFKDPDFLWATVDIAIWSDIEQGLAIIAASLATLRPLYRIVAVRLGFTQASQNPLKESGIKELANGRSDFSTTNNGRRKRPGPFTLMTMSRNAKDEEEYGLGDCPPIQLRDDLVTDMSANGHGKSDAAFASWKIQGGETRSTASSGDGSEDELHHGGVGGIMEHKEIYMTSEIDPGKVKGGTF